MGNDGHFGQFKTLSKKANISGWNVLRYDNVLSLQIPTEKMNF